MAVVLLALVVALALGVATSASVVCAGCHGEQTEALASTSHAGEDCLGCHLGNGAWDLPAHKSREWSRMYPAQLINAGLTSPARQTSREVCLRCHADVLDGVMTANGLRVSHASCARDASCDSCHSSTAHPEAIRWAARPEMNACVSCHEREAAGGDCDACHVEVPSASARPTSCVREVTHGADWEKTHGVGGSSTCGTCHPEDYCDRCHTVTVPHPVDFGATHGRFAAEDREACARCHPSDADFCDPCHLIEMPHPEGFAEEHATVGRSTDDARCLRCHADNDCEDCHKRHVHPGGAGAASGSAGPGERGGDS